MLRLVSLCLSERLHLQWHVLHLYPYTVRAMSGHPIIIRMRAEQLLVHPSLAGRRNAHNTNEQQRFMHIKQSQPTKAKTLGRRTAAAAAAAAVRIGPQKSRT